jgi:hypothetical protein
VAEDDVISPYRFFIDENRPRGTFQICDHFLYPSSSLSTFFFNLFTGQAFPGNEVFQLESILPSREK